jgi:hypothetical protein
MFFFSSTLTLLFGFNLKHCSFAYKFYAMLEGFEDIIEFNKPLSKTNWLKKGGKWLL